MKKPEFSANVYVQRQIEAIIEAAKRELAASNDPTEVLYKAAYVVACLQAADKLVNWLQAREAAPGSWVRTDTDFAAIVLQWARAAKPKLVVDDTFKAEIQMDELLLVLELAGHIESWHYQKHLWIRRT